MSSGKSFGSDPFGSTKNRPGKSTMDSPPLCYLRQTRNEVVVANFNIGDSRLVAVHGIFAALEEYEAFRPRRWYTVTLCIGTVGICFEEWKPVFWSDLCAAFAMYSPRIRGLEVHSAAVLHQDMTAISETKVGELLSVVSPRSEGVAFDGFQ